MFLKEISSAHQGYIYFNQKYSKNCNIEKYYSKFKEPVILKCNLFL